LLDQQRVVESTVLLTPSPTGDGSSVTIVGGGSQCWAVLSTSTGTATEIVDQVFSSCAICEGGGEGGGT
jgi:hypothetical protein